MCMWNKDLLGSDRCGFVGTKFSLHKYGKISTILSQNRGCVPQLRVKNITKIVRKVKVIALGLEGATDEEA
jgi:hypothetical protein